MGRFFRKIVVLCVVLLLILNFTACGKKNGKISEYGNQDSTVLDKDKENDTADSNISEDIGSLSDKLGTERIEWQDSFDGGGVNYKFNIMYDVPDMEHVPIYKFVTLKDSEAREKDILNNLFGDDYSEVHKEMDNEDSDLANAIHHYLIDNASKYILGHEPTGDEIYSDSAFYNSWVDYSGFYLHTYEGVYQGKEYYVFFGKHTNSSYVYFAFLPKNISEFMEDDRISFSIQGFSGNAYNMENESMDIKEDLKKQAEDFIESNLYESREIMDEGVEIYYYNEIDKANSEIIGIDGYAFNVGRENIFNKELTVQYNYSYGEETMEDLDYIEVSSKGINIVSMILLYESTEQVTTDTALLDEESIKEMFIEALKNNADFYNRGIRRVSFDHLEFEYFPIPNPENENEASVIPVWHISAGTLGLEVIINAVDGSIVYMSE